jgi:predicted dehydrogenase
MNSASPGTLVRWGILGTGTVAAAFAQDLALVAGSSLTAVCSRDAARARQFATDFGARHAHGTRDSLLRDDEVDVVYIATPHHRHRDDCIACLSSNRPVLCEKPFALNAAEARSIVDEARARRLFCMEAMWTRFHPLILKVRAIIQSRDIGEIRLFTAQLGYPTPFHADNRFFNPALGGGALLDRGVYLVSLSHFFLGQPSDSVSRATIGPTGVDEQTTVVLTYAGGALAVLTTSLRSRLSNEAIILGTKGRIHVREPFYAPHRVSLTKVSEPIASGNAQSNSPRRGLKARLKGSPLLRRAFDSVGRPVLALLRRQESSFVHYVPGTGYQYEAAEVARCIRAGLLESPIMPLDETVTILQSMDSLRDSWKLLT